MTSCSTPHRCSFVCTATCLSPCGYVHTMQGSTVASSSSVHMYRRIRRAYCLHPLHGVTHITLMTVRNSDVAGWEVLLRTKVLRDVILCGWVGVSCCRGPWAPQLLKVKAPSFFETSLNTYPATQSPVLEDLNPEHQIVCIANCSAANSSLQHVLGVPQFTSLHSRSECCGFLACS